MQKKVKIIVALLVVLPAVFVGGPWVYINLIREPAAQSFVDQITATSLAEMSVSPTTEAQTQTTLVNLFASLGDVAGVWQVGTGSQVGYRVDEVLFGQNATAVGRTSSVIGTVTIADGNVTAATFTADMTMVRSDNKKRDAQFESRIMDVLNYPTATFTLESPIALTVNALSEPVTHKVQGSLTLRGTTKLVELEIIGTVRDKRLALTGEITIVFADWGIPNPSIPGISTEDSGVLEFQLNLDR